MKQDEQDQFRRVEFTDEVERANMLIGRYFEHIHFYVGKIAHASQELGRINERLGG